MGTKLNPGAFDCYANATPDEPMFVLLGRDRHAPGLVRLWALLRARVGEDEEKIAEALACADAMDTFSHRVKGKAVGYDIDLFDKMFEVISLGLSCHPEGFDEACQCDTCRTYAAEEA